MTPAQEAQDRLRRALLNDEFPDNNFADSPFSRAIPDPLGFERNSAVSAWMSQATGRNITAGSGTWQAEKDALVQGFFKMPTAKGTSDQEIHGLIRQHVQTADEATMEGINSALAGTPSLSATGAFEVKGGASKLRAKWPEYTKELLKAYSVTAARVAPYRELIQSAASTLNKEMGTGLPTTDAFKAVADQLLEIPVKDRRIVVKAIAATGAKTPDEQKSYLGKLGTAFGRMTEALGSSAESGFSDMMSSVAMAELATGNAESISLIEGVERQREKNREYYLLANMVRKVADSDISPLEVEGWVKETGLAVAQMAPMMASSMVPFAGVSTLTSYYRDDVAANLMLEYEGMTSQTADRIAGPAAPIMAAAEHVSNLVPIGRLPVLGKYLKSGITSMQAGLMRGAGMVATGTGVEVIEEGIQQIVPRVIQDLFSAVDQDVPGVNWNDEKKKLGDLPAQVIGPAFAVSLIGGGVVSVNDVRHGRALAADRDLLVTSGYSPSVADKIVAESTAGNWQSVDALMREAYDAKKGGISGATPEERQAALSSLVTKTEQANQDMQEQMQAAEVSIAKVPEGWRVSSPDGSATFADHDEAFIVALDRMKEQEMQSDDNTLRVFEEFSREAKEGESFSVSDEILSLADAEADAKGRGDNVALDAIYKRAEVFRSQTGRSDLPLSQMRVLGRSSTEFKEGVATYANRIFEGGRAIDLLEEKAESDVKRFIAQGRTSFESMRTAIQQVEQATGDTYLHGDTDTAVIEAYSDLARLWASGSRSGTVAKAIQKDAREQRRRLKASGASITQLLQETLEFFKQVLKQAARLMKAKRAGKLGDIEQFLNESLGLSEEAAHVEAVTNEVQDMAEGIARNRELLAKARDTLAGKGEKLPDKLRESLSSPSYSLALSERLDAIAPKWPYEGATDYAPGKRSESVMLYRGETKPGGAFWTSNPAFADQWLKNHPGQEMLKSMALFNNVLDLTGVGSSLEQFLQRLQDYGINPDEVVDYGTGKESIKDAAKRLLDEDDPDRIFEVVDRFGEHWNQTGFDAVKFYETYDGNPGRTYHVSRSTINTQNAAPIAEDGAESSAKLGERDSLTDRDSQRHRALNPDSANSGSGVNTYSIGLSDRLDAIAAALNEQTKAKPESRRAIMERAQARFLGAKEVWERIDTQAKAASRAAADTPDHYGVELAQLRADFDADLAEIRDERETEIGGARTDKAGKETINRIKAEFENRLSKRRLEYERDRRAIEDKQSTEEQAQAKEQGRVSKAEMTAAMRALDAVVSILPPEVRGKVGGFIKLAELNTTAQRLDEIDRRFEKVGTLLEKHFQKELTEQVEKTFDKYRPEKKSGEKPKGKLDPDVQQLIDAAEAAMDLDETALSGELARIEALLADPDVTPEQEVQLDRQRSLVELFGDWKNADAARMSAALDALKATASEGWAKWKIKQLLKREEREEIRGKLRLDTGKSGVAGERDKMLQQSAGIIGKGRDTFLNLSSFSEVLRFVFGQKSKAATALIDSERVASNQYEDAIQEMAERVQDHFTTLAGGVLKGEQMRYDMSRPKIKAGNRELSELQAIQALLMWQQADGQRHMEGPRDENGQPIPEKWSYDQAFIDELTSKLPPRAMRTKAFFEEVYGEEYGPLNALYRERHGVNLPRHSLYAPITVAPQQAKAGEMTDPVSGAAISGSILTPGALRSRNRTAVAEPRFEDALATMLAHHKQMEHWKAYYSFAVDAQAVLGNRDVMNSAEAAAGKEAVNMLRKWVDAFAQGGIRDATAGMALTGYWQRMANRAATVGLLGRVSTLLVQSTQLAAASVQMPTGAYMLRLSKLLSGNLSWGDAVKSDFIQRRIKTAPPIVRQAMANLGTASRPNQITSAVRFLGNLLSGADGLFTGGTYAILLDYHRGTAAKLGLEGAEAEAFAHQEATRATEEVAQPVRMGNRSMMELTMANPFAKAGWAYASEARQKIALLAWSKKKGGGKQVMKTAFLTFVVGGLMSQVIKNLWREMKGDDDEEKWSAARLAGQTALGPLHGVPLISELTGNGGMFSGAVWAKPALEDLMTGEADAKDIETLLSAAGYFSDTFAGISALSHAGFDFAKVLENVTNDD